MSSKFVELRIAHGLDGVRLDKAVVEHPDVVSRSQAQKLIQEGKVLLAGKACKASRITERGEVYLIELPEPETTDLLSYDFPLDIYYEDDDLIIVNKPSGLVVHPSSGHGQDTLVNALVHHNVSLSSGSEKKRPGIVHRIDKDTSGLLVVAKTDFAHTNLCEQFRKKTVHRIYQAAVYDLVKQSEGTIESYLKRHPTQRKKYASEKVLSYEEPTGKRAITHYKVLKTSPKGFSLIQCQLETGRTHQIRVHLSESRHPILGDSLYGSDSRAKHIKSQSVKNQILGLSRIALHAMELGFIHPTTQKEISFKAPWPKEMIDLLQKIELA